MNRGRRVYQDRRRVVIGTAAIVGIFVVLVAAFSLAYFVTAWIYAQIGQAPAPWLAQIINSVVGLFLIASIMAALSFTFGAKQRSLQMGVFRTIVDALDKIAQGDFSIRLDDNDKNLDHDPMGLLVKSVNSLAQELDQMEEMRQEFISNVSHEIQSPLTSIRGFAHALRENHLTESERVHYLNIIETESTRLSKLSENLLALAALDSENYALDPKPFRLDLQIRDLVLACEPQWKDKELDMEVSTEPVMLVGDEALLSQVWSNLIHNSIKFTPPQGKVCLSLRQSNRSVTFRITDTGIGIAEPDREHVFERFYKADKARERARGGSGLGLAIAKKIVDLHHGTIAVAGAPEKGSVFTVVLPAPE